MRVMRGDAVLSGYCFGTWTALVIIVYRVLFRFVLWS